MLKFVTLTFASLATTVAMAIPVPFEQPIPVLYKDITSGFVPEDQAFTLHCDIFEESYKMVVVKNGKTSITRKHLVLPELIQTKIIEAASGTMTYVVAPADIGNRIYGANIKEATQITPIDLGSSLDSRTISKNSAPSAEDLKSFIDHTCVE